MRRVDPVLIMWIALVVFGLTWGVAGVRAQQTYLQQATLAADADFVARISIAGVKMAYTANLESDTPVSCVGRAADCATKRKSLATQVASNPNGWAHQIAIVAVGDTSITSGSTDQALIDRVFQIWNLMAGA